MLAIREDGALSQWRRLAQRPLNGSGIIIIDQKRSVGIGNALFNVVSGVCDALLEGRVLVVSNFVFQKFCSIVQCGVWILHNDAPHDTVARNCIDAEFFAKHVVRARVRNEYALYKITGGKSVIGSKFQSEVYEMGHFHEASGCNEASRSSVHGADARRTDDPLPILLARRMCLFSKIMAHVINAGFGSRLLERTAWLKSMYIGDSKRFDEVFGINAGDQAKPQYTFDAVVHIRTLFLLESFAALDHSPLNPINDTIAFLASPGFESMLRCFAEDIAARVLSSASPGRGGRGVRVFLATDGALLKVECADRLRGAIEAALLRADGSGGGGWGVFVDFFSPELAPSHWHDWSDSDQADERMWDRLVGTTAEWLMLARGEAVLMERGLRGGERAIAPSSFAYTAAIFGRAKAIKLLVGSQATCAFWRPDLGLRPDNCEDNKKQTDCKYPVVA